MRFALGYCRINEETMQVIELNGNVVHEHFVKGVTF